MLTAYPRSTRLFYVGPVPSSEKMSDNREWWSPERKRQRRNAQWKRFREAVQRRLFGPTSRRLIETTRRIQPSGHLLDVGAGTGRLLEYARPHFERVALEPSPIAARILRDAGLAVCESTLEDAELPNESFDVIVLDSVMEHVTSPMRVARKLHELLKPGGIVCLKTPKFGGPTY